MRCFFFPGSRRRLSHSPPEGFCGQSEDRKLQHMQTSFGKAKCGPQAMVAWDNRSSQTERGEDHLNPHALLPQQDSHSEYSRTEDLPQGSGLLNILPCTTESAFSSEDTSLLPETGHSTMLTVSISHKGPLQCMGSGPQKQGESTQTPACAAQSEGLISPDWQHWQRERQQIWQKLSLENTDSLQETPV